MNKHFIVEREDNNPATCIAFELFETRRELQLIQVGVEILFNDSKYRVKRIETIFETNPMCAGYVQDHINIYLEEI